MELDYNMRSITKQGVTDYFLLESQNTTAHKRLCSRAFIISWHASRIILRYWICTSLGVAVVDNYMSRIIQLRKQSPVICRTYKLQIHRRKAISARKTTFKNQTSLKRHSVSRYSTILKKIKRGWLDNKGRRIKIAISVRSCISWTAFLDSNSALTFLGYTFWVLILRWIHRTRCGKQNRWHKKRQPRVIDWWNLSV